MQSKKDLIPFKEIKIQTEQQRTSYNFRQRENEDISSHGLSSNKDSPISSFNPSTNSSSANFSSITQNYKFNREESHCSPSLIDEEQSSSLESYQCVISRNLNYTMIEEDNEQLHKEPPKGYTKSIS